jgi:signal transduction histidine kinase/ligand-binding sensor domain-containing protein/DNA-binding response OmpR family regulator
MNILSINIELSIQKFSFANLIIVILILGGSNKNYAQNSYLKFEHFSIEQGLPSANVTCLFQDRKGYIWFGTDHGLARYDGYFFEKFTHSEKNTTSISNATITAICEDKEGNIWVGHAHGLDKFNLATEKFTHYILNPKMPVVNWCQHVLSLLVSKDGTLWVGTGDGLYILNKSTKSFSITKHADANPNSIIANSINALYEDRAGSIWIGTGKGLDRYDRLTQKFVHLWTNHQRANNSLYIENNPYWVVSVFEDREGKIWFGTNNGLICFNPKADSFSVFNHQNYNHASIINNSIFSICEDSRGFLWVTTHAGLDIFDKKSETFSHQTQEEDEAGSLSSKAVSNLLFDRSGTIWISASNKGVYKYTLPNTAIMHYTTHDNNTGKLPSTDITSVAQDNRGMIWLVTGKGLVKFNPVSDEFKLLKSFENIHMIVKGLDGTLWMTRKSGEVYFKKEKSSNFVPLQDTAAKVISHGTDPVICISSDGGLWAGTNDGGNIVKFYPFSSKIRLITKASNRIEAIYEDRFGWLWIGTEEGGILCYDPSKKSIHSYIYNFNDPYSISGDDVTGFCEDRNGTLWIIANHSLNKFDRVSGRFYRIGEKEGFPENVFQITKDNSGNLWLSTPNGSVKYSSRPDRFKPFANITGWSFKDQGGRMYYFNKQGITRFDPDSLRDNRFIPSIVITSFRKFDKPYPFGTDIRLPYNDNFISFEFSALSFREPERNQYAYKMDGVDKTWVYSGTRRYASYPSLQPGKYIFRVKGSNNDGIWNEAGTSVTLLIFPPWWKTLWAYSAYGMIFLFSLYWIRRYEMNRLSFKNQVKTDAAVLKEKEETEKLKSRFFANISHEFRTPLTLILGPAEKIYSGTSDDIKKDSGVIKRNSHRLLQLVNQLLELSRLEAGKLKLEASKGNIVSFVKGVALSFESLAESKDITLTIQTWTDQIEMYFDKEKMMQILSNILSNAFKFTQEEGKITVSIRETDQNLVEIKISDTGIGIAPEEIPKLFDRFYQVDSSLSREFEGTGIGLALTKELVELHQGKISVTSIKADSNLPGSGWTEFSLEFPLGIAHLTAGEIAHIPEKIPESGWQFQVELNSAPDLNLVGFIKPESVDSLPLQEDKTIVLVVEDNYDMRQYIKDSLNSEYFIEEAVNGEQGVRKAQKIIPDLVISDLMMPKMDGNEMLRILKNDERTSHIPVILLTAKASHEDKLDGLETGADDYLTKPFDIKELQYRVRNLISIRKKLQEKFSKTIHKPAEVKEQKISGIDEKFMQRVNQVIEKHISEEEFDIQEFCGEVAMSRTQLHRKLKALTGKSASLYIRSLKLARAKIMIEDQQGTISEIAYSVGFSSPVYFTRCFREEFGYPPSELKK